MKLTVSEAASLLGSAEDRVYDWIEEAALPAQKIRGQFRINRTDLLEWATQHNITLAPRAFRQERGTPSLAEAYANEGVQTLLDQKIISSFGAKAQANVQSQRFIVEADWSVPGNKPQSTRIALS